MQPRPAFRVLRIACLSVALATAVSPPCVARGEGAGAASATSVRVESTDGPLTARLTVTPARPALGAPIDLSVHADAPLGGDVEIVWPDLRDALKRALGEHVVEVESVRLAPDRRSLDARLRLYDEGVHELPPLVIGLNRAGEPVAEVELGGASLEIDVALPEDAAPAPPRDAVALVVPPPPFPWWTLGAAAAVLAALAVALVAWRRRARVVPPPPPPPPAHEKALAALRSLAGRGLPERGEVEPYFVALSEILRTYVEDRFALRAPEQTTEEFLATVSHTPQGRRAIEAAHRDLLRDFLTRADLVKFARARPAAAECAAAGSSAERFVRETATQAASRAEPVAEATA